MERRDRLIDEGNDIYYIINEEMAYINGEIDNGLYPMIGHWRKRRT